MFIKRLSIQTVYVIRKLPFAFDCTFNIRCAVSGHMSKQAKNFVRPAAEGADLFDEAKMEAQTAKLKKLLPARKAEQEPIS